MSINKATILGRLGADPEIRHTQSDQKIANMRIATAETWRDKATGEKKERTQWHTVVSFNDNVSKLIENYAKKGARIHVEGQLETRKWQDQSGNDRYSTEIVIRPFRGEVTLIDWPETARNSAPSNPPAGPADLSDEIPF